MADPSVEHARLACALGHVPPVPRGIAPLAPAPERASAEIDSKAIEKAVIAALVKQGRGGGDDGSPNRKNKSEERNARGRLPDGKRCKAGRRMDTWILSDTQGNAVLHILRVWYLQYLEKGSMQYLQKRQYCTYTYP
eukprot:4176442-Prymnesium_polylepis.1